MLSIINLQSYHPQLLEKIESELQLLFDKNLTTISRIVLWYFWVHLFSIIVPIVYSLSLQLSYLSKMIENFQNVKYLSSTEMASLIK